VSSAADLGVLDALEIDRELYRKSFRDFVPDAFEVLEGGSARAEYVRRKKAAPLFVSGWHIDAIAEHLQAVSDGQIKRLLINVPPGTMKSVLACVLWPAWMWALDPKQRFLFSSYSEEFTKRDARKTKNLIKSEWFAALFPHTRIAAVPETQMEQHTTAGGERHGASTNSGVTGKHVNGICEDDPLKLQDATSASPRALAWEYRTQALGFRLLPEGGWRVVVMQRLHEDDVSGRILERRGDSPEDYEHLCLPMELEPGRRCSTSIGFVDPRKEEGELLWPARMTPAFVAEKKRDLGPQGYAGQAQQRPSPAEGVAVKREHFRERWTTLPPDLTDWLLSCDLTFKLTGTSYVALGVWAKLGAKRYLIDQTRERLDFNGQLRAIVELHRRWPQIGLTLIEEAANGHAALSVLREKIPGVVGVRPDRSKEARLSACLPNFEAGDVVRPHESVATWVPDFIEELITFPNGANDDQCFIAGTRVAMAWGDKAIEEVREGDEVLTPCGTRRVLAAGCTGEGVTVERRGLQGTAKHPVYVEGRGFVPLDQLTQALVLSTTRAWDLIRWRLRKRSPTWARVISSWDAADTISKSDETGALHAAFTSSCGREQTREAFAAVSWCTTATEILSTIAQATWRSLRALLTRKSIARCGEPPNSLSTWPRFERVPKIGTDRLKGSRGTARNACRLGVRGLVPCAALSSGASADRAGKSQSPVPDLAAHASSRSDEKQRVYNLRVEGGVYYANGVLVHNCDQATMALERYRDNGLGVVFF
jgi:predicted phage terminase large subunit-like protein